MRSKAAEFFPQRGEMAALIRERDWTSTALGAPATWSPSLRTVLRLMLTSRYAMWMGWGRDLTFFYNDAYAQQTLGAKHPWALGMPASEVWSEIWETISPRVQQVITTGEATWDEGLLLLLNRNGYAEETYHTFSYSPAPGDAPGETAGLFCVVIEETERVISERRIAALRDFAALLSHRNTVVDVFRALEKCLSIHARDVTFFVSYLFDDDGGGARLVSQTGFTDALHPGAVEHVRFDSGPSVWPFRAVLASGANVIVELPESTAWPTGAWQRQPTHALVMPIVYQGQTRPAGVLVAGVNPHRPLDDGLKSFVELIVGQLCAGLSNSRAYEDAHRRAEALAELDRAKTTFFSNVSHEFRTPLTLMLGPTEDALSSPERALRGADLETVHRNELRLLKLVNALLDFARIEAGRIEASYEPTDLAALTADLASSFRSAVERARLRFDVDCEEISAEPVFVDHDMWEKIVLNLLSNALKFTFEGSIAVQLRHHAGRVELTVQDTGVGIDASELPRLFERFHRVEGARSRTHEGSGIGLALVHDLVRLHGGKIDVKSELGRGTTFTVSLPTGNAHLPVDRLSHTRQQPALSATQAYVQEALRWVGPGSQRPSVPAPEVAFSGERIIVADDNADMRDYITRLLRERWDVEAVADGQAALDAIRRQIPALVLTDVMMPALDGFGLLRAIRSDAALRSLPVILLSARAGEEASVEGLGAGADDYIVKPFSARDLVVRVTSRLAAARAARETNLVKENLYRHFMQAPFPVAVLKGPHHVVELANHATLHAWRRTEAQALGRPLLEVLPELATQSFLGYMDDVLRTGKAHEGTAELASIEDAHGKAHESYYSFVYAPLLDARGKTEGVLMSAFDVTTQVRARQDIERARDRAEQLAAQLANTANRLHAAQQVAGIGIFDWNLTTQEVYWSPELFVLMGRYPDDVSPSAEAWTSSLFDDAERERGWHAFRQATESRSARMEVELRLAQPEGGSRWIRLSTEIQYVDDQPSRVLGAVVDIQVLKEAAAARARALEEAERTSRAKDEFLATMSHELRTPLNAMLGWAKILKANPHDQKKLAQGLAVIDRNAETQARLVSDLLDVSRIISGKLRLSVQNVDVASVVVAAADVVRQAADAKGLNLVVDVDSGIGTMLGDADRLQQIVWNLLSNAVKFTPRDGTVTVSAERSESNIMLRVQDTGAGVPAEQLPLIFDRFKQVDSSTTRAHGGLGLGLAIVRHLTEAHGGTVAAHSAGLGAGATFTVRLPIRAVFNDQDDPRGSRPTPQPAAPAPTPRDERLKGARILIVDDEQDSLDLLRIVLESAGASVTSATDVSSALDQLGKMPTDLVVSDIGMPGVDGYSFMQSLRTKLPSVPAVALTAYARAEDRERAYAFGYQRHLSKPVNASELVATLAGLLGTT